MPESIKQAWYVVFVLGFPQSLMGYTWALGFWYGGKLISMVILSQNNFFNVF
ncbi:putative ABC transporter type 1, transmembrane domain superfamily [Helianthus anomalus]